MLKWESLCAKTITGHFPICRGPPISHHMRLLPRARRITVGGKANRLFCAPSPSAMRAPCGTAAPPGGFSTFPSGQAKERRRQSALALDDAFLIFRALSRCHRGLGRHCRHANAGPVLSAAAVTGRCLQRLRRSKPLGCSGPACYACAAAAGAALRQAPRGAAARCPTKARPCDTIFTHWASQCMDEESSNVALR